MYETTHGQHAYTTDCLECVKESQMFEAFERASKPWNSYADSADAGAYVDGTLKALVPVGIYSGPTGNLLKTVPAGGIVGVIESYVVKDGSVWWMLKDNTFVKHGQGLFDEKYLNDSLTKVKADKQAVIDEAAKKRMDANGNPLYVGGKALTETVKNVASGIGDSTLGALDAISFVGKNLKWILIIILLLILVHFAIKIKQVYGK